MSVKFSAEIRENLRQGDHDVIVVNYTTETGETKRAVAAILRQDVAAEFLKLINGTDESHLE